MLMAIRVPFQVTVSEPSPRVSANVSFRGLPQRTCSVTLKLDRSNACGQARSETMTSLAERSVASSVTAL